MTSFMLSCQGKDGELKRQVRGKHVRDQSFIGQFEDKAPFILWALDEKINTVLTYVKLNGHSQKLLCLALHNDWKQGEHKPKLIRNRFFLF